MAQVLWRGGRRPWRTSAKRSRSAACGKAAQTPSESRGLEALTSQIKRIRAVAPAPEGGGRSRIAQATAQVAGWRGRGDPA